SAHEDANIIFGAVLDEKMGEEVKITVIATGFRDQMPERRARMLNVEEAPVVSVPVVATNNWMRESDPEPAARTARFQSEEEEEAGENAENGFFFAAAAPGVATTVTVAAPPDRTSEEFANNFGMEHASGEVEARFDAMNVESQRKAPPRDYAGDFSEGSGGATKQAQPGAQTAPSVFAEPAGQAERDLDVPTFLRRLKF
ncbi:MAG: hypothetical protein WBC92_01650, partial [Terracidiphilus sp.]